MIYYYIFNIVLLKKFIFQNYQCVTVKIKQTDIEKLLFA